jgi:hypothetical protein
MCGNMEAERHVNEVRWPSHFKKIAISIIDKYYLSFTKSGGKRQFSILFPQ